MERATSRDGTRIAYWRSGQGPPLVLVHGTAADHTRWRALLPFLQRYATVHAIDRRGRGASGDGREYALEREYEDVAAVVDAVAISSAAPVDVYGHSFGGLCAFGAAGLTDHIRRLALYEGWPLPDPSVLALPAVMEEQIEALLEKGDREAVVEMTIRHFTNVTEGDMAALRAAHSWPGRVAAAHTIARECRAGARAELEPGAAAGIDVPVLLLVGEYSADPARQEVAAVASLLRAARVAVLEGQEHTADAFDPGLVADHLLQFLGLRPGSDGPAGGH
jgi:pimeloyl-ACP methyl ester carboxylesterase